MVLSPQIDKQTNRFRILSIDGGGYLGLATAAFIRGIENHFDTRVHNHFDLFCGTSTGAMIALGLASGKSGDDLVTLYKDNGSKIFRPNFLSKIPILGEFVVKHTNVPLRETLNDTFGDETLEDLFTKKNKRTLITTYCLTNGRPCLFKTNHSKNLTQHGGYRLADIALASSAAPTFFPLVEIYHPKNGTKDVFCDGGVAANHPALLGYSEALSECECTPDQIQILSLSTPRTDLAERNISSNSLNRGLLGWRKSLAAIFTDSNAMLADQLLKRIAIATKTGLYERVYMDNRDNLVINNASKKASESLESLGADMANNNETRARLRPFFN